MSDHIDLKSHVIEEMKPQTVREEFDTRLALSQTYRFQMAEDNDFYLGNQYTQAQKDYLKGIGQSDQPNNKIKPAVEQVLSNAVAAAPQWEVRPRGLTDNDMAFVINHVMDKIWEDSEADAMLRTNARDYVVKGLTYSYVYPDWNADGGLGALRIMDLPPESVYPDLNSIKPNMQDSSSIIYSDLHTRIDLIASLPQFKEKIEDAEAEKALNERLTGNYSRDDIYVRGQIQDNTLDMVRKFIRWAKVPIAYVKIINLYTGYHMVLDDEQYEETVKDAEFNKAVSNKIIAEEITYRTHIRETFVVGNQLIYDEILPISEYPIRPACNDHARHPQPSGDVRQAKGPQRKLNRTEALIIAHASATANVKFGYEAGAIEQDQINKMNLPGSVPIKFNPGGLREGKIHEFQTHQVSSELYHEKERYENDIEDVFGAYKFLRGDTGSAPGTVGEAQLVDEASARKQNWKMLPIYDMLTGLARVALEWMPYVYDQQRILRLVNDFGKEENVILNQLVRDKSGAVSRALDMTSIDADIKAIAGSARAKSPMAKLQKNLVLKNAGIYDNTEVTLQLEENIDKEALLARTGEIQQLTGMLEQATEKIKNLEGLMQTRDRELYHTKMDLKVSDASKGINAAVADLKGTLKSIRVKAESDAKNLVNQNNSDVGASA